MHNLMPNVKTWDTMFIHFNSGEYDNLRQLSWYIFVKFLTLGILSIWYLTCVHKWRYFILFPIIMEVSKITFLIKSINNTISNQFFVVDSLYISIPFILVLLLISRNLLYFKIYQNNEVKLNNEFNQEIFELSQFNKKNYKFVRNQIIDTVKRKNNLDKKEYLIKLIELRDRLII